MPEKAIQPKTKGKKKINDMTLILLAMIAGSLVGIIVGKPAAAIGFIGDVWLNLMKMFLVPIVIAMLVKGIASMDSPKTLGRIGVKILAFYVVTTILASVLGLGSTWLINPGKGFQYVVNTEEVTVNSMPSVGEFFTSMFSIRTNVPRSMARITRSICSSSPWISITTEPSYSFRTQPVQP